MYFVDVFCVSDDVGKPRVSRDEQEDATLETLKFNFNIESLGLVLYRNDPEQVGEHMRNSCWCVLLV